MNIPRIALRNIFRNRRRSLLSLSAIAIVTATITFMFAYIEGMKHDQQTTAQKFLTGEALVRRAGFEENRFTHPEEFLIQDYPAVRRALAALPETADLSGRLQFPGELSVRWKPLLAGDPAGPKDFGETVSAAVIAPDFERDDGYFSLAPFILPGGRIPGPGEILVAEGFANRFGLKRNDTVFILGGYDSGPLVISGLVSLPVIQLGQKAVFIPLATAQDLLSRPGEAQEILIRFAPGTDPAANLARAREALGRAGIAGLEIKAWNEIDNAGAFIEMAAVMFNFIAFFFFAIGTTVIVNTTMMVIYERLREIGTLRAMGMTGREMIRLFFMEAFFISSAAALVGVCLGAALVLPLSVSGIDLGTLADVSKMNMSLSNVIYPQLNFQSTLFVFVYSVAVASLISFIPTRRAARIEPVEALRSV